MPAKPKFYGVRCGREGPQVYQTWANCAQNTSGYSGALYKGFNTKEEAQSWVDTAPKLPMAPYDFTSDYRDNSPLKSLPSTADEARSERSISPIDEFIPTKPFKIPPTTSKTEAPPLPLPLPVLMPSDVILSPEQDAILVRVNHGESLFFTGSAGTGKSVLLREIIKSLGRLGQKPAVTASTGIAAVNIGGVTLHSWAGIGLGKERIDILIAKIRSGKETRKRWTSTNTLIIDEISMIDGVLFDKLDAIGRALRHNSRPFGGIQLVVSGDFLQLPPVPDQLGGIPVPITFAFESDAWNQALGKPYILSQVFRQKETDFIDILTRMRYGELDIASIGRLRSLSRELFYSDGIGPTELYPRRDQVEKANKSRLELIPESLHCFQSRDIPGTDSYGRALAPLHAQKVLDRLVAVAYLELKVGAQVMLIKNLVQGHLVNGSVGKVISFETPREAVDLQHEIGVVDQEKDPVTVTRRVFSDQSNDNRKPLPVDEANKSWPLVSFPNGRKLLIMPEEFEVMNARGLVEATRRQVPLILAWALSVHKSQGLTLDRVKVNLASTFEKGQAYVALSRATSLKRLEVMGFDPSKVKAHPTVIAWEKTALVSSRPVVAEEDFDAYFDEWNDDELAALAMEQYHETSLSK